MPVYVYKVRDLRGRVIRGKMEGETLRAVINKLRQQKFFVISTYEENPKKISEFFKKVGLVARIGLGDLTLFSRQLATLINAGIPILQCLNVVIEQIENKYFKDVIRDIREEIERGSAIHMALEHHPNVFSNLYTAMVKSGETGGVLDEVLERIASYLEKLVELRRKVITAIIYPITIATFATAVVTFLLVWVVPKFQSVYDAFGGKLPLPTQILILLANFLKKWILVIILVLFIVVVVFLFLMNKIESLRYKFDKFKLRVPLLGPVFKKVAIARFARTLGTLIRSGVPILESLEIVAKTTGNLMIEKAVLGARSSIREGERIVTPLRESGVFPSMVLQMTTVGEETGALDSMLLRVADYYDMEVDASVARLSTLIEPILIVVMGVVVGSILIAMYLPIFQLGEIVGR